MRKSISLEKISSLFKLSPTSPTKTTLAFFLQHLNAVDTIESDFEDAVIITASTP